MKLFIKKGITSKMHSLTKLDTRSFVFPIFRNSLRPIAKLFSFATNTYIKNQHSLKKRLGKRQDREGERQTVL